ncbi:MAG TPA: hypothetical protein DCL73_04825 [Treponema sp.]|nr:hypothetical protein [Treponema sp.]
MKKIPLFIISILLSAQLMSCTENISDVSGCYYPFRLYDGSPVITLAENGTKLRLQVDTGSSISYIFRSGLKKMDGEYDAARPMTLPTDFYLGYQKNKPVTFFYNPAVRKIRGTDGILGMDALSSCDYLVIEYRKKQFLMTDKEPECRYWITAESDEGCFKVPVIIENIRISATLDTGSDANNIYVPLRTYPRKYREKTILLFTQDNSGIYVYERIYEMKYTLPDSDYISAASFSDMHAYADKLFPPAAGQERPECLLGYPFFKNNFVCLDFKNGRIGIIKE